MKQILKERAIALRKKGLSYSAILKQIPIAKSTLSLWFRSVSISKPQKQKLTLKRLNAAKRGGFARRKQRILLTNKIIDAAQTEIRTLNRREIWLMGIMLYWAEGSKAKPHNPSEGLTFSNSDPLMAKVFLKWLCECLYIKPAQIVFEIYIHEIFKARRDEFSEFWSTATGFPQEEFGRIYYKRQNIRTNKRIENGKYHGLLRIRVRKSTNLNRKIAGWIKGVCLQCGVVQR